jgi:alpha-D-xyloside xylohydrolase
MGAFRREKTAAGTGAYVLNAWPLMHTAAVHDGQLRDAPDKRVFILTRSAYAGQQRNAAATWSGDIQATWDVFKRQIPAGLNFCLSGIPYWTTDIGGFFVPQNTRNVAAYKELYTRWFEYGAFCPLFRSHGTDMSREMWRFGPETEATLRKYDDLRYRLMPYIYSQAWNVTHDGGTLMRPLVMDHPDDETALILKDEFQFGPSFLVCPVTDPGVASRTAYLPKGASWIDFWTGKTYAGGQSITADAPIETIPLFVKAGSIVPLGPKLQYVDEKAADPLEVRVYPGADGALTLYEDEGDNNNYLKGKCATIAFQWDQKAGVLRIGDRSGSFEGMLAQRTFRIVLVGADSGGVEDATVTKTAVYSGKALVVSLR